MKRVLILDGSPRHSISEDHADSLEDLGGFLRKQDGYETRTTDIQHTALEIIDNSPRVLIDLKDDIKDFNLVIFRNASIFMPLAAPVCLYLDHHQVPYANGMTGAGVYTGKIAQMFLYALNGLPVPDSLLVRNPDAAAKYLPSFIRSQKIIVKDNNGIKGKRNYLFDNDVDIRGFLDGRSESYIIQPYINNSGDYRVLYMGYDNPPMIFRRSGADNSHLNNTSQGGTAELVDDLPGGVLETARKAAELFDREIAGVDILLDENGHHYVLEVNETPAIASGFMPEAKFKVVDRYIRSKLNL